MAEEAEWAEEVAVVDVVEQEEEIQWANVLVVVDEECMDEPCRDRDGDECKDEDEEECKVAVRLLLVLNTF